VGKDQFVVAEATTESVGRI